jgi:hypothetical protein
MSVVGQQNGTPIGFRDNLNFIGVQSVTDNSGNDCLDITVTVRGSGTLASGSLAVTNAAIVAGCRLIPTPTSNVNLGNWWVTYNLITGVATVHSTTGTDASGCDWIIL